MISISSVSSLSYPKGMVGRFANRYARLLAKFQFLINNSLKKIDPTFAWNIFEKYW